MCTAYAMLEYSSNNLLCIVCSTLSNGGSNSYGIASIPFTVPAPLTSAALGAAPAAAAAAAAEAIACLPAAAAMPCSCSKHAAAAAAAAATVSPSGKLARIF